MIDQLRTNRTLRELITGAFVYCILWEAALIIFTKNRLYHSLGLAAGFIVCAVLAMGMADSIDVAVDLDEKSARAYLQKKASLRYAIACISILIIAFTHIGNPLTFFAGIMGLKIGAYMQPLTHAVICRITGRQEANDAQNSIPVPDCEKTAEYDAVKITGNNDKENHTEGNSENNLAR